MPAARKRRKKSVEPKKGRQKFPPEQALRIQRQLDKLRKRYRTKAEFYRTCGVSERKGGKWFGPERVVPEAPMLAHIATVFKVSLDWLVLDEPESLLPPRPVELDVAKRMLYTAVMTHLEQEGAFAADARHALERGFGSDLLGEPRGVRALWDIVVSEAAELPSIQHIVRDMTRWRDDD